MKPVVIIGAGISGLCTAALLAKEGIGVEIYEKSRAVGGRTASTHFRGHTLDNGFHIMPFYKKSALYWVMRHLGIASKLDLVKVDRISFYREGFYRYPRGILDILGMSLVPVQSRMRLLGILVPMAFSSMQKAERADSIPLSVIANSLDAQTRSFFDAVCMLAFADVPERVSLGEFIRTIIRANPFRGGTSEFAYPGAGGYDRIACALASYITETSDKKRWQADDTDDDDHTGMGRIHLSSPVKKVIVEEGSTPGIVLCDGRRVEASGVVVSCPAYDAADRLFEHGTLPDAVMSHVKRLNRTTSVVETHYCLSERVDERQIVFPVGDDYTAKGVFFISNSAPSVSPNGEHLMMAGTPVSYNDAKCASRIREISDAMKSDVARIYPGFDDALLWERPMAWSLVESVAKEPGIVWKDKMPHDIEQIRGLYFVGDSTISYGIGTDSAAHSSVLCHPKIMRYLAHSG